ncbi:MAG: polyphosphate kinase 2 family protein [Bacteroidetes bacterium]|nr:polyphosphate kinase 2 family protein [Bacteroidota bacterium]
MSIEKFVIKPNSKIDISKIKTDDTNGYASKEEAKKDLTKNIKKMISLQDKLYAEDKYSMLLIFQAMDAAGKDGTIKHVMSGLNPQGTQVTSFKQPSAEELNHNYLWRINKALPERGRIGILNRSYYEEVLVVRVHDLIKNEKIPKELISNNIWNQRFKEINDFEKYLFDNGTVILKFFLHVSKEEQKKRFLERIDKKSKNWKFSEADIKERQYWDEYQKCYQEAISATSKKHAPWFIIPADHKWFMRLAVSEIIIETMSKLPINYPSLNNEQLKNLAECKKKLESEK